MKKKGKTCKAFFSREKNTKHPPTNIEQTKGMMTSKKKTVFGEATENGIMRETAMVGER